MRLSVPGGEPRRGTSTIEQIDELLAGVRRELNEGGRLPSEMSKLRNDEGKYLALRSRLEQQELMIEDRVVRSHPAWLKLRAAIIEALRPHPEAMRAVKAALEAHG